MSPPVLVMLDLQKGFDIYCDASRKDWDVFLCKKDMSLHTRQPVKETRAELPHS
jgi:hypothetical protein